TRLVSDWSSDVCSSDLDPAPVRRKRPAGGWRRRSWPGAVAALLVLALVGLAAAVVAVYRIETDKGELVITADDPDIDVLIKQNEIGRASWRERRESAAS